MNYKSITQIKDLNRGDIVRHKSRNGFSYVVNAVYGDRATAITTADMTNPDEWEVMLSDGEKMDNAIKEIIEDHPEAYARDAENANKQPEESARQAVAENKKHAEFNRLFSRIGPKVKPEYRHQRVVITD